MQQKLSIEYQPIVNHAVVQSATAFLAGISVLDLMLTLTNLVHYGFWPPAEFHLAPIALIIICAVKIRLNETEQGDFDYKITVFGIELISKRFSELVVEPRGKFSTLMGRHSEGLSKTFITWTPSKSDIYSPFFPTV